VILVLVGDWEFVVVCLKKEVVIVGLEWCLKEEVVFVKRGVGYSL